MLTANYDVSSEANRNQGLADESDMFVSKVEPRAPRPDVPATGGIPAALRTVSSSQGSVQEAMFDAKRAQIQMAQTAAANPANRNKTKSKTSTGKKQTQKKQHKPKSKGKATPKNRRKHKDLFGTPGDIFKYKLK